MGWELCKSPRGTVGVPCSTRANARWKIGQLVGDRPWAFYFPFPVITLDVRWFPGMQQVTYERMINSFSPYPLLLSSLPSPWSDFLFFSIPGPARFGGSLCFIWATFNLSFSVLSRAPAVVHSAFLYHHPLSCCNPCSL